MGRLPKRALNRDLIRQVASLLCQPDATAPTFMYEVGKVVTVLGYAIECHQRGEQGTYIRIVHSPRKKDEEDEGGD